jgi:hypothetical protein
LNSRKREKPMMRRVLMVCIGRGRTLVSFTESVKEKHDDGGATRAYTYIKDGEAGRTGRANIAVAAKEGEVVGRDTQDDDREEHDQSLQRENEAGLVGRDALGHETAEVDHFGKRVGYMCGYLGCLKQRQWKEIMKTVSRNKGSCPTRGGRSLYQRDAIDSLGRRRDWICRTQLPGAGQALTFAFAASSLGSYQMQERHEGH